MRPLSLKSPLLKTPMTDHQSEKLETSSGTQKESWKACLNLARIKHRFDLKNADLIMADM